MSNFLVLATGGSLINPDGAETWTDSIEAGGAAVLVTRAFSPQGVEGDAVFRRVYLSIEHKSGVSLAILPIVDEEPLEHNSRVFSFPGAPLLETERQVMLLPLFRPVTGRGVSTGVRGRTLQLKVTCWTPNIDWWLGTIGITFAPGSRAGMP